MCVCVGISFPAYCSDFCMLFDVFVRVECQCAVYLNVLCKTAISMLYFPAAHEEYIALVLVTTARSIEEEKKGQHVRSRLVGASLGK